MFNPNGKRKMFEYMGENSAGSIIEERWIDVEILDCDEDEKVYVVRHEYGSVEKIEKKNGDEYQFYDEREV